jgi:hypothetical protein
MKKIEQIFEEAFAFLVREYNFIVLSSRKERWGYYFTAINSTTGIEIEYEFREALIRPIVYRLVNGKIVKNTTSAIKNNKPIMGFSLEWILTLKNPEAQIKPAYEYGVESKFYDESAGLENYASFVAERLKEHADDVLKGDFSIFNTLDALVKENYKNYYTNSSIGT